MFMGISHLILTIQKYNEKCDSLLKQLNYHIKFKENKILNHPNKKDFMKFDNKYHNIYFFKHKELLSLELIEYNKSIEINSNIIISLTDRIEHSDLKVDSIDNYDIFYNSFFKLKYILSKENIIYIKTRNIDNELFFWKKLGFTINKIKKEIYIKSPIKQWNGTIKIIKDSKVKYTAMDLLGVHTICLLTNNIKEKFEKIDGEKSEIFNMKINNKNTKNILIKRGSYNIEILEIK